MERGREGGGEDTLRLDNQARRGIQHPPHPRDAIIASTPASFVLRAPPMKVRKEGRKAAGEVAFTSLKGNEGRAPTTTGIL